MIAETDHRPWPLPARRPAMRMRWHDLLFAHWPVPPDCLRPLIPPALELDTFHGRAWIGVVPFTMSDVGLRSLPGVPGATAFPEINVRTYVKSPGRSGVWFFSLDAESWLSVRTARVWYGLPYYDARIRAEPAGERVRYHSVRTHRGAPAAEFAAEYGPVGEAYAAEPRSLEHFLTERYCLYAARRGRVGYGDIHHAPWPLQPAEAEIRVNTMVEPLGIALPPERPLLHFARRLDVVAWSVAPLAP